MNKQQLQEIMGRNLHRVRVEQGMTREELAEKAGISVTFYSNLESGNKMMSLVTLRKLANVLCVSTDSLIYEDHPDDRTAGIQKLLQNQPDKIVSFVEKVSRLIAESDALQDFEPEKKEEGKETSDECLV